MPTIIRTALATSLTAAVFAAAALAAPVAADPADVCFYEDADYGGASFCAGDDQSWVGVEWNDRISSVKVPSGGRVVLFEHIANGGSSTTLGSDVPDLAASGFDNRVSAFDVQTVGTVDPVADPGGRAAAIPVGIENVNDSPMKSGSYRHLIRLVPRDTVAVDRIYFGFKLKGAKCHDEGSGGYGRGTGGTLKATLVRIDPATGLPGAAIDSETVNGCTRYDEAKREAGGLNPVLGWVDVKSTLTRDTMYGLIVQNVDSAPSANFFSVNLPLADAASAGPHTTNELDPDAPGALLSLDPREHVAWSADGGQSWKYGEENGQYRSYMRDRDTDHPAVRMPQYGFRLADGTTVAGQPYYGYSVTCTGCAAVYQKAIYAREFSELGGFTADDGGVGTLKITNLDTGAEGTCRPTVGFGLRTCTLASGVAVAAGESFSVSATGSVEVMKMDGQQRSVFPAVGSSTSGPLRVFQSDPAPGTGAKDVPGLWAGPLSAFETNE